jgi:membrane associated rhomboid family serine protease
MFPVLTPATRALIIVNVVVFLIELVAMRPMLGYFALWPLQGGLAPFHWWQLVTYAFLHAGLAHIFFNMFALYVFGPALEQHWGGQRYLVYYFVCVIAAGATQLAADYVFGGVGEAIGASGGIFGILLAFAILFPRVRLLLYFAIPVPAWLFVTGYAVLELFFGVTGTEAGVAHFAHLGGMLGGAIMMLYWRLRAAADGGGARWPPG